MAQQCLSLTTRCPQKKTLQIHGKDSQTYEPTDGHGYYLITPTQNIGFDGMNLKADSFAKDTEKKTRFTLKTVTQDKTNYP